MDLKEALLKEHSKKQTQAIANFIGNSQQRFDALMDLFFNEEYRVVQRSAWVVSYCADAHPELIQKYFKPLIENLSRPNLQDPVKRNTLHVFQIIEAPDDMLGNLVDICFAFINSAKESIAIKAYSINILVNTCSKHPELKEELLPLLNELLNQDSPAILSCSRKGISLLAKIR
jgi:hypothetical protein